MESFVQWVDEIARAQVVEDVEEGTAVTIQQGGRVRFVVALAGSCWEKISTEERTPLG